MSLIAAKFGGSSLCDAKMFRAVHRIISASADRRYIVLSAPGKRGPGDEKVTDLFLRAYAAEPPEDQFIFAQIFQRYASIRDCLCPSFDLEGEMTDIFRRLRLSGDFAASRGEYLCAKLFAASFDIPFVDAEDLLFFDARGAVDRKRTFDAVRRLLRFDRAVIPGFYASSPGGIKTFPRGGSDVSAAWIAAALHADLYENWTDVDGVFSADPAQVKEALPHLRISQRQMRELALAGANILHPDALLPILGSGMDMLIKNTFHPEAPGTLVCAEDIPPVPAVAACLPLRVSASGPYEPLPLNDARSAGRQIALVSVFGANAAAFRAIESRYKSIHIIHMPEHIQIITELQHYQTVLADVHRILAEHLR